MKIALGVVIMVLGASILALLSAFVHWAHEVFTITFNQRFEFVLIVASAIGGACIASGAWSLVRARRAE